MANPRPNLLLIMPDQLRSDAIFGPGTAKAKTPNLDRLAREGVSFENAYCQSPACTPSRCSIFTGLYPHTHGHRTMHCLLHAHERNLFRDLREAGYRTVNIGKNDFVAPDACELAFDRIDWKVLPEEGISDPESKDHIAREMPRFINSYYLGRRSGHPAREWDWAVKESALKFLEDESQDGPWCLSLTMGYPHTPYHVEEPFFSMHDRKSMPEPISAESAGGRDYRRRFYEKCRMEGLSTDDLKEIRATYLGMVSRLDSQVGEILDKLAATGQADNTTVIFFSDHGDYAGDYHLPEKWHTGSEDCLLRVPLIFKPCKADGGKGGVHRRCLVEMIDLYPTVLDLAGVQSGHYHFGRSLLPLFDAAHKDKFREVIHAEGGLNPDETHCFSHYGGRQRPSYGDPGMPRMAMLRTQNYKYICAPLEHDELYDQKNDPGNLVNLADDPACAARLSAMRLQLLQWFVHTSGSTPFQRDGRGFYDHFNQLDDMAFYAKQLAEK